MIRKTKESTNFGSAGKERNKINSHERTDPGGMAKCTIPPTSPNKIKKEEEEIHMLWAKMRSREDPSPLIILLLVCYINI